MTRTEAKAAARQARRREDLSEVEKGGELEQRKRRIAAAVRRDGIDRSPVHLGEA